MSDLISRSAKRLIDANALIEERAEEMWQDRCDHMVVRVTNIENAPTVDAVHVVRCKDCKWYKEGELLAPNKFCFRLMHPTDNRHIGYNFSGDDFCSYGERKDDER